MAAMHERHLVGLDYLGAVTVLLQRIRVAHPAAGLYQAAELQWWWRDPRPTDDLPQLFWFDEHGRPVAAVIANDFGDGSSAVFEATTLVAIVLPDASSAWTAHVLERGLAHAAACGLATVDVEIDADDAHTDRLLRERGFEDGPDGLVLGRLDVADRPVVSPLPDGYRLTSRAETADRPHHFGTRARAHTEERLHQTSLYQADLDLVVHDATGAVAAYGLFWHDPVSATGVVEPMRTETEHQRRGLARHVLTAGIDVLAAAGATHVWIGWEADNPASGHLYRSVGFTPVHTTRMLRGPTAEIGAVGSSAPA